MIPAAALLGLLAPVLLLPSVAALAHHLGAVAVPRDDRWGRTSVPTIGGLAMAIGVIGGTLLLPTAGLDRFAIVVGLGVMATVGLVDDLVGIAPWPRLMIESATGAVFTGAVTGGLDTPLRLVAVIAAAICVPVAVNATNLVDNADGLASLLSAVSGFALAGIVAVAGIPIAASGLPLVIAAACVGFLIFNRPPARVYMGDSGSLMLGFGLAAASILVIRDAVALPGEAHLTAAIAIPLVWAFQVGDLVMVFVTRLRRRDPPFQGNVDHTSHRLMNAGLGPVGMLVVVSLGAASVAGVAVGLAALAGDYVLVAGIAILAAGLVGAFEILVAWRLPYRDGGAR